MPQFLSSSCVFIYSLLCCRPNSGFMEQLRLFELMGNKVDPDNEFYRRHRLRRLAAMMQGGEGLHHRLPLIATTTNTFVLIATLNRDFVFRYHYVVE